MQTFVIGDLHGRSDLLSNLLHQVERELTARDTVVFLGDYVDRGPDSKGVIDKLLEFQANSPALVRQGQITRGAEHACLDDGFGTRIAVQARVATNLQAGIYAQNADRFGNRLILFVNTGVTMWQTGSVG